MQDGEDLRQVPISDVAAVRAILIEAAKARRATSYAEVLYALGYRFSRPKMRALCKTLDAVDTAGVAAGEPELAVLVVRESDRLPGQGWWVGCAPRLGYDGLWTGPDAVKFIRRQQKKAFDYWAAPEKPRKAKQAKPPKPKKVSPRPRGRNRGSLARSPGPRARP
jgi:hypothetical protein